MLVGGNQVSTATTRPGAHRVRSVSSPVLGEAFGGFGPAQPSRSSQEGRNYGHEIPD